LLRDKEWVQKQTRSIELADKPKYPRIIKPRSGTGSMGIHFVDSAEESKRLLDSFANADDYISEPFHRGPLYSAELWSDGQSFRFFGVTNRIMTDPPLFLERVKTFPHEAGSPWEKLVKNWSRKIVEDLDYNLGLAHIEFIETKKGFQLVEINSRLAGALITPAIDCCTNYDPYALAVADALCVIPNELPKRREISGGHSHVTIYANRTGRLESIDGTTMLSSYPGRPTWLASKHRGADITDLTSWRARLGHVYATGPSPAIAQDRAIAAASAIRFTIE
ncbi:ATP-grasp domain-containing protein, partial [Sphingomonas sp. Leaf242]|uniref:ATP-grasp domain-containing protein n=1 Tax=Sphingomonas sp. Leaf242 TaxID=1736304 RepID=UPI000A9CB136